MFHSHSWKETGRYFTPPCDGARVNGDSRIVKAIAFGFTTITLQCILCGDLKSVEQFGNSSASSQQEKPQP